MRPVQVQARAWHARRGKRTASYTATRAARHARVTRGERRRAASARYPVRHGIRWSSALRLGTSRHGSSRCGHGGALWTCFSFGAVLARDVAFKIACCSGAEHEQITRSMQHVACDTQQPRIMQQQPTMRQSPTGTHTTTRTHKHTHTRTQTHARARTHTHKHMHTHTAETRACAATRTQAPTTPQQAQQHNTTTHLDGIVEAFRRVELVGEKPKLVI
jgi:hypothetical protein